MVGLWLGFIIIEALLIVGLAWLWIKFNRWEKSIHHCQQDLLELIKTSRVEMREIKALSIRGETLLTHWLALGGWKTQLLSWFIRRSA